MDLRHLTVGIRALLVDRGRQRWTGHDAGICEASHTGVAASELARACGAAVHVLLAVRTFGTIDGEATPVTRLLPGATRHLLDLEADAGARYVDARRSELAATGIQATASVVRGSPAAQITAEAARVSADLIVLGTHGRHGLGAFWAGSAAARICASCTTPLLLVPESSPGARHQ